MLARSTNLCCEIPQGEYFTLSNVNKHTLITNKNKLRSRHTRKFALAEADLIRMQYAAGSGEISYRDLAIEWNCGLRCINQVIKRLGAYRNDP